MENNKRFFEDLYNTNKQSIFLFALARTNSREDALDITAEVFLSAWENIDGFKGQSSYRTWLFAICRHKVSDYYRKSYKEREFFDSSYDIDKYNEKELEDNSDIKIVNKFGLHELLSKLKEVEKELILLKYMNNLSFSECADVLRVSETNARVMHHRIISKLKSSLIN